MNINAEELKFDENGLVPAVVQDCITGEVLMVGYMNREALDKTIETGDVWFFSRSRQKLWHKGETSGNHLKLREIRKDCDGDALLVKVVPTGPVCHTGKRSCFFSLLFGDAIRLPAEIINELIDVIHERYTLRPEGSYTAYLFNSGLDKILKKVGEESAEVIIAAKNSSKDELVYETADLLYHVLVLLKERNVTLLEVIEEFERRKK